MATDGTCRVHGTALVEKDVPVFLRFHFAHVWRIG
jgi:hypothetical protein